MANMLDDGFIDEQIFVHAVATTPVPNLQYQLDSLVSGAISTAAVQGLLTITVNVSAYSANSYDLVIRYIKRLVDMGYTASLSTSTLTVTW